jgi:hypothetical protein
MLIHKELGWKFREQHESDHGIDAQVETVVAGQPTGRLIALQIKSGPSWFKEPRQGVGWVLRGPKRNLSYWLKHQLPVLVVLFDPRTDKGYWVHVRPDTATFTPRGYRIIVPASHPLDSSTKSLIEEVIDPWRYSRKDEPRVGARRYDSDLVDDAFAETLANSLRLHHVIHQEPLGKNSFTRIMKGCGIREDRGTGSRPWGGTMGPEDRRGWLVAEDRGRTGRQWGHGQDREADGGPLDPGVLESGAVRGGGTHSHPGVHGRL